MADKHTLVFIPGMGDADPLAGFQALWNGMRETYDGQNGRRDGDFEARYQPCFVQWHDVTDGAERIVFEDAFAPLQVHQSLLGSLLHPIAFGRTFFTFFLGDVVAYVDESPNNIRTTVWERMKRGLTGAGSFSIIAHSLGSVIAFDFLYHLFVEGVLFDPVSEPAELVAELQRRLAGFYTMGSPVGLFMLRKGSLWKPADAERAGAPPFGTLENPIPEGRVWQNFWDKQDVIAYPLERLFATNPANAGRPLRDVLVNTGAEPIFAHIRYWGCKQVARRIAATLE